MRRVLVTQTSKPETSETCNSEKPFGVRPEAAWSALGRLLRSPVPKKRFLPAQEILNLRKQHVTTQKDTALPP